MTLFDYSITWPEAFVIVAAMMMIAFVLYGIYRIVMFLISHADPDFLLVLCFLCVPLVGTLVYGAIEIVKVLKG